MHIFQVASFIIHIIFWGVLSAILIIPPKTFVRIDKYNDYKCRKKSKYEKRTLNGKLSKVLERVFRIMIAGIIIVVLIFPYVKDLPMLITGKLTYVTGQVTNIESYSKDPCQYVYLGEQEIVFFFDSGAKIDSNYNIGYLPNTNSGIYIAQLDNSTGINEKELEFPFKSIFQCICIIIILLLGMALLCYIGYKFKFKLLFLSCAIFYPTSIYLLIRYGIASWIWFSVKNQAFLALIIGLSSLLFLLLLIKLTKYKNRDKDKEVDGILFMAQVIAVGHIMGTFFLIQDWLRIFNIYLI